MLFSCGGGRGRLKCTDYRLSAQSVVEVAQRLWQLLRWEKGGGWWFTENLFSSTQSSHLPPHVHNESVNYGLGKELIIAFPLAEAAAAASTQPPAPLLTFTLVWSSILGKVGGKFEKIGYYLWNVSRDKKWYKNGLKNKFDMQHENVNIFKLIILSFAQN